jgi:hypothetical protein
MAFSHQAPRVLSEIFRLVNLPFGIGATSAEGVRHKTLAKPGEGRVGLFNERWTFVHHRLLPRWGAALPGFPLGLHPDNPLILQILIQTEKRTWTLEMEHSKLDILYSSHGGKAGEAASTGPLPPPRGRARERGRMTGYRV